METNESISERLIALLKKQQFVTAYEELFSEDAESIDPLKPELSPVKGLVKLIEAEKLFLSNVKIHSVEVSAAIHSRAYFAVRLFMDVTVKGNNTKFDELCVYKVHNGKIVSQQFFITG